MRFRQVVETDSSCAMHVLQEDLPEEALESLEEVYESDEEDIEAKAGKDQVRWHSHCHASRCRIMYSIPGMECV